MGQRVESAIDASPKTWGLRVAEAVVIESMERMEPQGEIADQGWEGLEDSIANIFDGGMIPLEDFFTVRMSLEYLKADGAGDHLIAATKMAFSSMILAAVNQFSPLLGERGLNHNDVHLLAQKAVSLVEEAEDQEAREGTGFFVYYDESLNEKARQEQNKGYLGYLLDNAIRPEGNGQGPQG